MKTYKFFLATLASVAFIGCERDLDSTVTDTVIENISSQADE
jgi:hypothetical protein